MTSNLEQVRNFGIFSFIRKNSRYSFAKDVKIENSSCVKSTSTVERSPYFPFGINNEDYSKSWHSEDVPNSWIKIHFRRMNVHLSYYMLKSSTESYPISWDLQVLKSNKWINISTIRNCHYLKNANISRFDVDTKESFNTFRFLMNGKRNTAYETVNVFELFLIEFFGVIERCRISKYCKTNIFHTKIVIIIIIIS